MCDVVYHVMIYDGIRGNICDVLPAVLSNVSVKRNKGKKQQFCPLYFKSI